MVAYEGNEPYVFISYAHKDKDLVLPIIQGLQDRGFRVWYDEGIEVGNEWPDFIAEHLEGCCGMVAFVSQNFGESNNCREELGFAKELEKTILVIYLEDRKKLRAGVRMRLSTLHYMNVADYANHTVFLDELSKAKALSPCLGAVAAPTPVKLAGHSVEELHKQADVHYERKEYETAVLLYRKAAERGYIPAQNDMGNCNWWGQGVPQNYEEAVKWYRMAAEQGYAAAQNNLGNCCYNGQGVPQNYEEAVKWYRMAADRGYVDAQFNMGACYQYGIGVRKNKTEALKWYQKAANQGYEDAAKKLKTLK